MIDLPPTLPPNLPNSSQFVIAFDASQPASSNRLTVLDLRGPSPTVVLRSTVAHGSGSDRDKDGIAEAFGNDQNSHMTSLGLYQVGPAYRGKYGTSYLMDGLDPTNSNARKRAVVLHVGPYVTSTNAGRSWGCPAISQQTMDTLRSQGVFGPNTYLVIYTPSTTTNWTAFRKETPHAETQEHQWTLTSTLTSTTYGAWHKTGAMMSPMR